MNAKSEKLDAGKQLVSWVIRRRFYSFVYFAFFAVQSAVSAFALVLVLTSCTGIRPLKGGRAVTSSAAFGIHQTLNQGDNPSQVSRQDQEIIKVRTFTLPAGARIEDSRVQRLGSGVPVTNCQSVVLSAPMPVVEREETRAKTELGAAQKDTVRELGAKLASLRGITWAGLGLFIFGLASLVWPPLKAIIGSVTTSAVIALGGLALMILPTLIVGNELFILGSVAVVVVAWFLAHRHGHLRGQLSASTASSAEEITARQKPSPTNLKTKN